MEIPNIYEGNYKLLITVPLALIVISLFFIPQIKQGVDFRGGVLVTIRTSENVDPEMLREKLVDAGLKEPSVKSYSTPGGHVIEIELEQDARLTRAETLKTEFFQQIDEVSRLESDLLVNRTTQADYDKARAKLNAVADELFSIAGVYTKAGSFTNLNALRKAVSETYRKVNDDYQQSIGSTIEKYVKYDSLSSDVVSANLSSRFLSTAAWIVVASAILTTIVVFILFRSIVPSAAVMIGAVSDITIAMGAMGLFGIPLTLASFAALLMLIGFSLDTDILLTMRTLKRKEGTPAQRAFGAMKTGMTMSLAAIVAFSTLFILSYLTRIPTYYEISSVALAGLVGDLFATWGINAVIILWYVEKKEGVHQPHHETHGNPKGGFTSIFKKE